MDIVDIVDIVDIADIVDIVVIADLAYLMRIRGDPFDLSLMWGCGTG